MSFVHKSLLPGLSLMICLAGCKSLPPNENRAAAIIDSIGNQLVPDQRIDIYNIALRISGKPDAVLTGTTTDPHAPAMIIKTLNKYYKNLIDSVIILPDTLHNKKYLGLVTLSVINMRKGPAHSAEMVSQALLGTPVVILKDNDGWYLIQTPDRYIGWTEKSSVVAYESKGMSSWRHAARVIYIASSGYIYSSNDGREVVGDIVAGCILASIGESHGYTVVLLPDGRKGYVRSSEVADFDKWRSTVKCTGESIVKRASSMTGLPYMWGGTSTKAVDCSGFSKTVFFMNGVIIQRDASQQALHGQKIDISSGYGQLRPGDLLFFGTRGVSGQRVTHVAIYEGNSEYINASGRVIVNSLDSTKADFNKYRVNSLLDARRIIGAENDPGIVPVRAHPWY